MVFVMMKKALTIFFILIANIILLAHAVIPHHHHESSVCVERILCPDCDGHKHGMSQNDCHHHDGNSSQNCVLNLAVFLPSNQGKQDCKCINIPNRHSQPDDFQAILFKGEFVSLVPDIISDEQLSSKNHFNSSFDSGSKGLRAPPVV